MKGYAKPLHEFIEGHKIQFVIPVYQRNYDWLIDNCDQLFSDLVKLVMERYTDIVDTLYDAEGFFWSAKQADTRYCTMIASQKYLWTSMDNRSKLRCLRFLFEKCDIAKSELVMLLEPVKE